MAIRVCASARIDRRKELHTRFLLKEPTAENAADRLKWVRESHPPTDIPQTNANVLTASSARRRYVVLNRVRANVLGRPHDRLPQILISSRLRSRGVSTGSFHASHYSLRSHSSSKSTCIANRQVPLPPRQFALSFFLNHQSVQCRGPANRAGIADKNVLQARIPNHKRRGTPLFQHAGHLPDDTIHIMCIPSHHTLVSRRKIPYVPHAAYYLLNAVLASVRASFRTNAARANRPEFGQSMTQPHQRQAVTAQIINRIKVRRRGNHHIDALIADIELPCIPQCNGAASCRRLRQ